MGSIRSNMDGLRYAALCLEAAKKEDVKQNVQQPLPAPLADVAADRKWQLIEKIKHSIVELLLDETPRLKNSEYISSRLNHSYTYLANVFSENMGTTIEQYIIVHKIERVKQLLVKDALSLTEISYRLNYSSVAHLSYQFKKITGLTPSNFKKISYKEYLPQVSVNYISATV